MSLHRLAQYGRMTTPDRRNTIMHEKHPSFFRFDYDAARSVFAEALKRGWTGGHLYSMASRRWLGQELESDFAIHQRDLALEAASRFSGLLDIVREELKRFGVSIGVVNDKWNALEIGDVQVVENPSVILRRDRMGIAEVGFLSFHMSKSRPHTEEDARMAAVLLYESAGHNQAEIGEIVDPGLCITVDVFSGAISDADYGRKRRMARVRAACEEIASHWPIL